MLAIIQCENTSVTELSKVLTQLDEPFITNASESDVCKSDKVILYGSGSARQNMKQLHILNLFSLLRMIKQPILGIGLGVELMCDHTTGENVSCLGLFPVDSNKIEDEKFLNSHSGFMKVDILQKSRLFEGIDSGSEFYFSENYFLPENKYTTSVVVNGQTFSASVERDNAFGVQFHPEKSGETGLTLLKNFINL
ncbi:MAG TPA: imidazole glycerol phosphate synthase subunit HisH [Ignavibacteriaceae bacterium]